MMKIQQKSVRHEFDLKVEQSPIKFKDFIEEKLLIDTGVSKKNN